MFAIAVNYEDSESVQMRLKLIPLWKSQNFSHKLQYFQYIHGTHISFKKFRKPTLTY